MGDDEAIAIIEEGYGEQWIESMCVNAKLGTEKCRLHVLYRATPGRLADVERAPEGTFRVYDNVDADLLETLRGRGQVVE